MAETRVAPRSGPEATFKVPIGGREPGFTRTRYRLELKTAPGG